MAAGRILAFATAVLAFGASPSFAGLGVSVSRAVLSPSGKFLLVLLTPEEERSSRKDFDVNEYGLSQETIREHNELNRNQEAIESQYSQSGLYLNDGSTTLLWPIGYLPTCKNIYVSDDGVHLVVAFLNWDWQDISDRGHAVDFYERGEPIASYYEDQLLTAYFPRRVLHRLVKIPEPTCSEATFIDKAHTFEIKTNWGDSFQFDVWTGHPVGSTLAWGIKGFYLSMLLAASLGVSWFWKRFGRKNSTEVVSGL
jgi:hypothetical protein